ncbi:hypothetical protein LINGRAHAP2_LOCUS14835, partial [Linum grandiflorum]
GSHVFTSRGYSVSISPSSAFPSRHFEISVDFGGRRHFVFVDEAQIVWLRDVLSVASKSSWKFRSGCMVRSSRREVVLTDFWRNGIRYLKVLERCRDGKRFYVLIPMDWNSVGGRALLGVIHSCFCEFGASTQSTTPPARKVSSLKSFAEVAAAPCFPLEGKCAFDGRNSPAILVSDLGVQERLTFLAKCLVLRLDSLQAPSPNWKDFRKWTSRWWGVPEGVALHQLGD